MSKPNSSPRTATSMAAHALMPSRSLVELGRSPLLDELTGTELVVYLRLLSNHNPKAKAIIVKNQELGLTRRTARVAIKRLEELGLIRVTFSRGVSVRQIELIPPVR